MNGVESSGTASLFSAISRFSSGVIQASAPSPREMSLRADNNRLSRDNSHLQSENRILESRKQALERENQKLEADVFRLESEVSAAQDLQFGDSASGHLIDTFA